jgi:MFS transporter, UMF1 family
VTSERPPRRIVAAWGLWNAGASAYHSVILTFVFAVYLTGTVGRGLPAEAWLGYAVGAAGLVIGAVAPAVGRRVDETGRPVRITALFTVLTALAAAALVVVRPERGWLVPGLVLLALGLVFYELATVPYNALLRRVTTPETLGRVSGLGWSMGYVGGVALLLVVLIGFVGAGLPDGWNIRLVGPLTAVWFLVLAIPLLVTVRDPAPTPFAGRGTYRRLWADLRELYAQDRALLRFLVASALYRDALMAIAAFGGIVAVTVYGLDAAEVPLFGIVASVVAALGALLGGVAEDRWGPRPVIVASLLSMLALGGAILVGSGVPTYWVLGLAISLFNGPVQSSSRTLVARIAPPGHEGRIFGLYTAVGRAAAFLAPWLFGTFVAVTGSPRAGIAGILVVLVAGTVAFLTLRPSFSTSRSG